MVFEVDNTTEKIIERLQDSIEGSIHGIHNDQSKIIKELTSLKDEFSQEEVLDSLRDVKKEMNDISDKLHLVKRGNEDVLSSFDRIATALITIQKYVDISGRKLDELTKRTEDSARNDELQKEQLDRITDYLKKPGIVRFFRGMKAE